jgi:hypothetical protein
MTIEGRFWLGVITGWALMLILSPFLPVLGPLVGGFVAGLLAKKGFWNGGKAGFIAGLFGAIVVAVILLIGGTFLLGFLGFLATLGIGVVLILAGLYYAILGLIGGAAGGWLGK